MENYYLKEIKLKNYFINEEISKSFDKKFNNLFKTENTYKDIVINDILFNFLSNLEYIISDNEKFIQNCYNESGRNPKFDLDKIIEIEIKLSNYEDNKLMSYTILIDPFSKKIISELLYFNNELYCCVDQDEINTGRSFNSEESSELEDKLLEEYFTLKKYNYIFKKESFILKRNYLKIIKILYNFFENLKIFSHSDNIKSVRDFSSRIISTYPKNVLDKTRVLIENVFPDVGTISEDFTTTKSELGELKINLHGSGFIRLIQIVPELINSSEKEGTLILKRNISGLHFLLSKALIDLIKKKCKNQIICRWEY